MRETSRDKLKKRLNDDHRTTIRGILSSQFKVATKVSEMAIMTITLAS